MPVVQFMFVCWFVRFQSFGACFDLTGSRTQIVEVAAKCKGYEPSGTDVFRQQVYLTNISPTYRYGRKPDTSEKCFPHSSVNVDAATYYAMSWLNLAHLSY